MSQKHKLGRALEGHALIFCCRKVRSSEKACPTSSTWPQGFWFPLFFMKFLIEDSVFAILHLGSQGAGPLQVEVCGFFCPFWALLVWSMRITACPAAWVRMQNHLECARGRLHPNTGLSNTTEGALPESFRRQSWLAIVGERDHFLYLCPTTPPGPPHSSTTILPATSAPLLSGKVQCFLLCRKTHAIKTSGT